MLAEDAPSTIQMETPPVKLKNNFWARLFQPFTEMYGLPAYNEFDPTFLMAITYSILFGIMYGDVGQGLVLIALGVFLYKVKGLWLGGILGSVGVFSTIFGFVFGSFFGYEHLIPGFHVLDSGANATKLLVVSAALGAVTIVGMMVINIMNGIRQKDIKKIFFTNNSLAGIIFYLAVVIGGGRDADHRREGIYAPVYHRIYPVARSGDVLPGAAGQAGCPEKGLEAGIHRRIHRGKLL